VLTNWEEDIARMVPSMRVHTYRGNKDERADAYRYSNLLGVVIVLSVFEVVHFLYVGVFLLSDPD